MVLIVQSLLPGSSNFILQMFNFITNTTIPDISMSLLAHNQYFMFLLMVFHAVRISHSAIFCDQMPIMFWKFSEEQVVSGVQSEWWFEWAMSHVFDYLVPQLVVLFEEVVKPLRDGILQEEVRHWVRLCHSVSLSSPTFPVWDEVWSHMMAHGFLMARLESDFYCRDVPSIMDCLLLELQV